MIINLIVAVDENNGIGKNNQLPWHLPADLQRFKSLTTGHPIIMGRKTFESIGRALPHRRNIVISRQSNYTAEDAETVHSIEESLHLCKDENDIFIIGGAQIFKQSLESADFLYLTIIHHNFDSDTFFPEIDKEQWIEELVINCEPDEKNGYPYTFIKYRRR